MKTPVLYDEILDCVRTVRERWDFVSSVDACLQLLRSSKGDLEGAIKKTLPKKYAEPLLDVAEKQGMSVEKPEEFGKFLTELRASVSGVPTVYLTLAFEPTEGNLENIYNWLRQNVKTRFFIDLKVDSKLVGGCVLGYNGVIKDLTLVSRVTP